LVAKAKFVLVFLCLALLQACSVTRLAYDNAGIYLRWQANGYFDFQGEQSADFDHHLALLLAWHRAKALPQYARLAEDASARVMRGIRREDLEWGYDSVKKQVGETLGAAAAESAGLLDRLSPGQIAHFEMRLAEDNREFGKEQVQGTVEQRHKRRVNLNVERLEQWFGTLNDAQVERVRRYSARAPLSAELRDRDRKRRQAGLLAMLRAREAKLHLVQWAQAWDRGREPAYANAARETETEYFDLLLDLDRMLTPAQREACAAKLQKYAALFDSLSHQ
jgi:Family of unknown function (DUF6279)